ncbi:hypothetical protein P8452_52315 [Trifolium repens]|nr:hypothetical protein P8452_52315 [Trifolium repens]
MLKDVKEKSIVSNAVEDTVVPDSSENVTVPEKEKTPDQALTDNLSDNNTIVNSQGDKSMKTVSAHLGKSEPSDKNVGTEAPTVDLDDLTSGKDLLKLLLHPAWLKD